MENINWKYLAIVNDYLGVVASSTQEIDVFELYLQGKSALEAAKTMKMIIENQESDKRREEMIWKKIS